MKMHNQAKLPSTKRIIRITIALIAAVLLYGYPQVYAADMPLLPPLNVKTSNPRLPGKFIWADLVTDDVPRARDFYASLFGWTFREVGHYTLLANDERPLAGMFQRARPKEGIAEPRWFGYISVRGVDGASRAVTKAGGRVLAGPQKVPDRGQQAIFSDPEGALFGVMKSSSGDPQDFLAEPGDWIWIQLLTRNAQKAAKFYRAVGDYDIIENTGPNRLSDFLLASEGYARAALRVIPPEQAKVQPTWLLFVRVKNVGESVARTKQLGGKALLEPKPEFLDGKVAVVADPTGAAIGLLEWSPELLKGGR